MPVLTEQQEDALVTQIIQLVRGQAAAIISIQRILRKLQTHLNNFVNNFEP